MACEVGPQLEAKAIQRDRGLEKFRSRSFRRAQSERKPRRKRLPAVTQPVPPQKHPCRQIISYMEMNSRLAYGTVSSPISALRRRALEDSTSQAPTTTTSLQRRRSEDAAQCSVWLPIKISPYCQGTLYFSIFLIFAFPVPVRSPSNAASPPLPPSLGFPVS